MNRRKHQLRPVLEALESVELLSGIAAAATPSVRHLPIHHLPIHHMPIHHMPVYPIHHQRLAQHGSRPAAISGAATDAAVALSGVEKGTYRVPGGGATAIFSGKGKVRPLGTATVSGTLDLAVESTTGQLTISDGSHGKLYASVKVLGSGPDYTYQITGGTKSFAGDTGSGVVTTELVPTGQGATPHGRFVLEFQGGTLG